MRAWIVLALVGCGGSATDISFEAQGPLTLDDAVCYFDAGTASLVVVDPAGGAGTEGDKRLVRLDAGSTPVLARSLGRPDDPSRAQVVVVDPGDEQVLIFRDKRGTVDALSIGVPLEALDVSADGRYGLAYQPDGATPSRSLFAFPNTVAVLDLDPASPSATPLRLRTPGARPLKAVFARSTRLSAVLDRDGTPIPVTAEVPLALVFVRGGIVPIDLHKGVAGPMLPLTPDADRDVIPAEVLFTDNQGDAIRGTLDNIERAFVRSTAGELYVLSITLSSAVLDDDPETMDVIVALENVVTPDATVADAELFFGPDGNELLLAAAGRELILVDGYTGVASRFAQTVSVDTLARFTDPDSGADLALGYSSAVPDFAMLRLDPLGLDQRRSTGVETLRLGSRVVSLAVVNGAARAVVEYEDGRDLGVLELQKNGAVLDLRFARRLSALRLSSGGDRLWLVSTSPEDEAPHLAEVMLGDLLAQDVRLDADAVSVGRAGTHLWVDHGDEAGSVTFFPDDDLRRESAVVFRAVLFTDLLTMSVPQEGGE